MRVLVCGGRTFGEVDLSAGIFSVEIVRRAREIAVVQKSALFSILDELHNTSSTGAVTLIINGGARGADTLSSQWAKFRNVETKVFDAEWKLYGKFAGFRRNAQMLEEGKPDLVVAFPGGRGTADMIARSRLAGVALRVIEGL
jgi:hypothetical protein